MNKKFKNVIMYSSMVLFAISLSQTAYCTTNLCRSSFDCLITGIAGFFYGGAAITWFANPSLFASWILINKSPKLSLIFSLAAIMLSLSFLLFTKVVDNEAGHLNLIVKYGLGYWLWLSSSIAILIGNFINKYVLK